MSLDNPTPLPPAASESPAAPLDRIELPAEDSLCEMPKGHTVATRVSFKDVLRKCEESGPSSDDRAHLQRWADDDRAEEVWHKIERAAQNNKLRLPAKYFIAENPGCQARRDGYWPSRKMAGTFSKRGRRNEADC
jgi:hypothetical protein